MLYVAIELALWLDGLSGAAGGFLAVVQLVLYYIMVKLVILGSTPRSIYNIKYGARTIAWGTLFPSVTLCKYLFFYQPGTRNLLQRIPKICLCALFFLTQDQNGKQSAVPEGALMVVLIVFTQFSSRLATNSPSTIPLVPSSVGIADKTYKSEPAPNPPTSSPSFEKRKNTIDSCHLSSPIDSEDPRGSSSSGQSNEPTDRDDAFFHKHPDGAVDYGFAHPMLSKPQRVVWILDNSLGLGKEKVAASEEAGIKATLMHATMDGKEQVEISGTPIDVDKF
ncbi:hypothetical protein HYDPIDRAFT_189369 [Hydnomerulius pinastri MD-312]|uniref:10TM putative phosphate transporter extracellular tail domain-containing protein n=1 Tax=Hydnomerulius pinastri MD-312 TaxID=994086 RepID=A0A0C9VUZ1_9AGAM|nr:hypothetical protein HYDPIDRAFT_189369 [Hydnomerulius pinastri MD-312]